MFEIAGLLIDIVAFLAVASIAGVIYALLAWIILRKRTFFKMIPIVGAGFIPIVSSVWIIAGIIFFAFQGKSYTLFGDIAEPLPNGFYLLGLGKMPDFASIYRGKDSSSPGIPLSKCVGGIAVYGPFVVGSYSHPCSEFTAVGNQGFFLFDTHTGTLRDYETLPEMEKLLGHPVHTVRTEEFHSQEPFYRNALARERAVLFVPPGVAMLGSLAFLLWLRPPRRPQPATAPPC